MILDKHDKKILELLDNNSRITFLAISKHIGMTEGAVRNRVKRLEQKLILNKFTLDYQGKYDVILLLEVSEDISSLFDSMNIDYYKTTGRYDYVCLIKNNSEKIINQLSLNNKIGHIDVMRVVR
ncbi:MAG: Lrp/AsnC family transcriptional regulator [Candidatus Woesearchaeota archaeon]